jgi:ferritin-like metal-binding protein YciE
LLKNLYLTLWLLIHIWEFISTKNHHFSNGIDVVIVSAIKKSIKNIQMKNSATETNKSGSAAAKKSAGSASGKSSTPRSSSKETDSTGDISGKLEKLFVDEVKDIYWAEKALLKALPKMAKNATSPELKEALTNHLEETQGHVERLEQVFASMDVKPQAKKCEAMAGLIKEGGEIMEETDKGVMRDAGIISAGQKVEHYEIATYGTLRAFAMKLGFTEAAGLLEATLEEEKAADAKLTEVTESAIMLGGEEEEE